MSVILQVVGAIWTVIGVLVALSAFGGMGVQMFLGGVGLGIFPGLVLVALGNLSGQVQTLAQRLAPERPVPPPTLKTSNPDPAQPAPVVRADVRPPWEKETNG